MPENIGSMIKITTVVIVSLLIVSLAFVAVNSYMTKATNSETTMLNVASERLDSRLVRYKDKQLTKSEVEELIQTMYQDVHINVTDMKEYINNNNVKQCDINNDVDILNCFSALDYAELKDGAFMYVIDITYGKTTVNSVSIVPIAH